jgi:hypothetical protein
MTGNNYRNHGHERLGGSIETLATSLDGHLKHEELEGLTLIDSTLNQEQWAVFAALHLKRSATMSDHTCRGCWTAQARSRPRKSSRNCHHTDAPPTKAHGAPPMPNSISGRPKRRHETAKPDGGET